MPLHCDSKDGPVVKAAMRALELEDVSIVLPFVPESAEEEVSSAFGKVVITVATVSEDDTAQNTAKMP